MEPRRDDLDLTAELHALRPTPSLEFATELDARAAAGFPRKGRRPARGLGDLLRVLRETPPRRLLAPAGAFALTAIVIATALVASSSERERAPTSSLLMEKSAPPSAGARIEEQTRGAAPVPSPGRASNAEGESSASVHRFSREVPSAASAPARDGSAPLSYAPRLSRRQVERDAQIVLGADPVDVRSDAAKVFDAVHAAEGIVLRSSITDGGPGEAGAEFRLLIPSAKLSDALAAFSAIDEVRLRHESTQDITAPTVGTGERLQDSSARIDGLLAQLAQATTEDERAAVEAELRSERRVAAALRSRLDDLRRRATLSQVSLRIETGERPDGGGGGAWGFGDGIDDAGRILAIAAGVTIIALAILAPFALLAVLAWTARRAWLRRARTQALT